MEWSLRIDYLLSGRRLVYAIILALAVTGYTIRLLLFPEFSNAFHLSTMFISIGMLALIWEVTYGLNRFLDKRMPYEKGLAERMLTQIGICLILAFGSRALLVYFGRDFIPIELTKEIKAAMYMVDIVLTLAINFGYFGMHYFTEWKKSLLRAERLQRETAVVKFDNLINQVNPHFLFNSLTSLNSLIFENQVLASQFLQQLSKVYRYVLQNKEKKLVSVQAELEFIQSYLFLLQTRFEGGVQIQLNIPQTVYDKQIVPVTLQILIENAIKHNIINEDKPLWIKVSADNDYLYVENKLQKKKLVETSNRTGLQNMRLLYAYLSQEEVDVVENGATFKVGVPLL
jgi:two-component system LytT family sensor kinase